MTWMHLISRVPFESALRGSDVASTGKWLVPISLEDHETWDRIISAIHRGRLVAAKLSSPILAHKLGHSLACIYCEASDMETARGALAVLRDIGIEGPLTYKSDSATARGTDEKLWTSMDFEGAGLNP